MHWKTGKTVHRKTAGTGARGEWENEHWEEGA